MKIFAVKDEENRAAGILAYLIYYETSKRFYIELPDDADPWNTPLLLSSFLKKGQYSINSYWSRMWVRQRIIPEDRQNLGQILKENGLVEYDEYRLLVLGKGRCAQDSYYLVPCSEENLAEQFRTRFEKKSEDVIPLSGQNLLVFFRDGSVKKCCVGETVRTNRAFFPLRDRKIFNQVSLQPGGYGVCWGDWLNISTEELYDSGTEIPLNMEDFISFVQNRVVSSAEAAELLKCSRQNISSLVLRGKLHPVKVEANDKYFLKSEILQRLAN